MTNASNDTKLNSKFIELYLRVQQIPDTCIVSNSYPLKFPTIFLFQTVLNTIDFNRSYDLATSLYTGIENKVQWILRPGGMMSWSWLTRVVSRSLPVCRIIILYRHVSRVQSRPDVQICRYIYGVGAITVASLTRIDFMLHCKRSCQILFTVPLPQRNDMSYDRKCRGQPMLDRLENSFD